MKCVTDEIGPFHSNPLRRSISEIRDVSTIIASHERALDYIPKTYCVVPTGSSRRQIESAGARELISRGVQSGRRCRERCIRFFDDAVIV
jgi:hypothetical protein